MKKLSDGAEWWLTATPEDLKDYDVSASQTGKQDIESELERLVIHAAYRAAYLGARFNTGCGVQSHKDADKHAKAAVKKIRKALGYHE
jgi:hypothetical protein